MSRTNCDHGGISPTDCERHTGQVATICMEVSVTLDARDKRWVGATTAIHTLSTTKRRLNAISTKIWSWCFTAYDEKTIHSKPLNSLLHRAVHKYTSEKKTESRNRFDIIDSYYLPFGSWIPSPQDKQIGAPRHWTWHHCLHKVRRRYEPNGHLVYASKRHRGADTCSKPEITVDKTFEKSVKCKSRINGIIIVYLNKTGADPWNYSGKELTR